MALIYVKSMRGYLTYHTTSLILIHKWAGCGYGYMCFINVMLLLLIITILWYFMREGLLLYNLQLSLLCILSLFDAV
ncbi:hypothetical protein C1I72_00205 [Ehrlichia canis]|nr:hypothetical protein C1I72_00205 [Ehrlichia canis]